MTRERRARKYRLSEALAHALLVAPIFFGGHEKRGAGGAMGRWSNFGLPSARPWISSIGGGEGGALRCETRSCSVV